MTSSDRDTLIRVHLISGIPYDVVKEVMESFAIDTFMNYVEGQETKIPYIGTMDISYKGDKIQRKGKQAVVEAKLDLDDFFVRNIGEDADKEKTEFEKMAEAKILESMKRIEQ